MDCTFWNRLEAHEGQECDGDEMNAGKKDYTNATQLRVFRIVMLLGDDVMTGWSPSQIAKALGITPPEVTRDMYNLEKAGWAIKNEETGRWTLGAKPGALGVKVMAAIDQAERKVAEARNRFTRN